MARAADTAADSVSAALDFNSDGASDLKSDAGSTTGTPEEAAELAARAQGGNLMYWVVKDGKVDERLSRLLGTLNVDSQLAPLIFAIFGSEIMTIGADGDSPSNNTIDPYLTLEALHDFDANKDVINKDMKIKCKSDDFCFEPEEMSLALEDFYADFDKNMEGKGVSSVGIIGKLGKDNMPFTDDEAEFAAKVKTALPIFTHLEKLSKDESTLRRYYQKYGAIVKLSYLERWFSQIIDAVQHGAAQVEWPKEHEKNAELVAKRIVDARKRLHDQVTSIREELDKSSEKDMKFQDYVEEVSIMYEKD